MRSLSLTKQIAAALVGLASVTLVPSVARATGGETRLAIVVGNNGSGALGRAELRYADDDAAKYAALFAGSAGDGRVELLTRFDGDTQRLFAAQAKDARPPTRANLEAAVARLAARAETARNAGDRVVLTFVFAGHGDVDNGRGFLELEDGRFFREDLEALLAKIPAARAHVLLDACNSVYMLVARKPGGTKFATPEDIQRSMTARLSHVGTFVSTSADAQVYEWSQIESGVFSHSVRSGLSGAADLDGDGRITYGELRAFVRIAAAGIPNERFRPRLYARGPGGHDDEVIFEPRSAGAGRRLPIVAGPQRRVTVLDPNEVPLVDVNVEGGFGTAVWVPQRETSEAVGAFAVVERADGQPERRVEYALDGELGLVPRAAEPVTAKVAARGAGRPFEQLFAVPYGPRAVAALPVEPISEEVYGVSMEDRERMKNILDAAAEGSRDGRVGSGIAGVAVGTLLAATGGASLLAPLGASESREVRNVLGGVALGAGALSLGFGAYKLLSTSALEARRDAYVVALRGRPDAIDRAVKDAESELFARAATARRGRTAGSIATLAIGALAIGGGIALGVSNNESNGILPVLLIADGAALGGMGIGILFLRTEEERMADLWKKERALPEQRQASSLRVSPLIGPGGLGLRGTF